MSLAALLTLTALCCSIDYLVEREGGWDSKVVWEDTLSLGEQQRLGMARLFYNKPKYGVLDECTSGAIATLSRSVRLANPKSFTIAAVSIDVERRLYKASADMGITSITLSQRLALSGPTLLPL